MMKSERYSFNKVCGVVLLTFLFASVVFRTTPSATKRKTIAEQNDGDKEEKGSSQSKKAEVPRLDDDFQLALRESLGFFDDIPAHAWQRMKAITSASQPYQNRLNGSNDTATRYYAANWDPNFSCQFEISIGQVNTDAHKWVCDPHRIAKKRECLVYSIGSNGNFAFELDLQRQLPNCEIHVFDPTDYSQQMEQSGLDRSNYHSWGLKSSYGKPMTVKKGLEGLEFVSLPDTMERLGHTGRTIEIFKIDCEGCEWSTHKDILNQNIRQILVEVHAWNSISDKFFEDLHDAGYAIFHKEPNLLTGGNCIEFAFLRLAKDFFE
ncbi:methyltransferase domain-containing protein [Fragilaria crotonensis]|nr:methyltransferase domain-containing protein [Fragilaria crotonensis]